MPYRRARRLPRRAHPPRGRDGGGEGGVAAMPLNAWCEVPYCDRSAGMVGHRFLCDRHADAELLDGRWRDTRRDDPIEEWEEDNRCEGETDAELIARFTGR